MTDTKAAQKALARALVRLERSAGKTDTARRNARAEVRYRIARLKLAVASEYPTEGEVRTGKTPERRAQVKQERAAKRAAGALQGLSLLRKDREHPPKMPSQRKIDRLAAALRTK